MTRLDFHANQLCFDTATFRLQPELVDSFHLLHRYRLEHLLTPRDFFYPRVAMDFYQSISYHVRAIGKWFKVKTHSV